MDPETCEQLGMFSLYKILHKVSPVIYLVHTKEGILIFKICWHKSLLLTELS